MNTCDPIRELVALRAAGEPSPDEFERHGGHLSECDDCRSLVELDRRLRSAAEFAPDLDGLAEVRRAVLRAARSAGAARRAPWPILARAGASLAAALALVLCGFFAGRGAAPRPSDGGDATAALQRDALRRGPGGDPLDSPFTYANVRLDDAPGERLRLEFDVSRHVDVVRPAADPLVMDVVAQALLAGQSSVGSRLKAVALAERLPDRRVRAALLRAVRDDPSPAVRLKAFAELTRGGHDPDVRAAAAAVLERESTVSMRLLALDYLAADGAPRRGL
jgi:hypothetical protein